MIVLKFLTALLLPCTFLTAYSQKTTKTNLINPAGFYELKGQQKGKETYGYFGSIKVKKISGSKIVISFFICKGYKSYSSGSFYDTLSYINNKAIYKTPEYDSTCNISFVFTLSGVKVDENTADFNNGCGFGHAVVAKAFFKRVSGRIPTNKEISED